MTHFVVVMPFCIPTVQNQLTNHLIERGFNWWHWGTDCWLLTSGNDALDADGVRSIIHEIIIPEVTFLVLRVDLPPTGVNWAMAGLGSLGPAQNWGNWLRQFWENPDWKQS